MDGLVKKIRKQNKENVNYASLSQDLFLKVIPDREEYEVDDLIGIANHV